MKSNDWLWIIGLVALIVLIFGIVSISHGDYPVTSIQHGCTVITHKDWTGHVTSVQKACP